MSGRGAWPDCRRQCYDCPAAGQNRTGRGIGNRNRKPETEPVSPPGAAPAAHPDPAPNPLTSPKHRPRKRFGQHFLTDRAVLNRLVRAFDAGGPGDPDDSGENHPILEIGPGLGALTDALVASAPAGKAARIVAVELDRDLARRLQQRYSPQQVKVIRADILGFDLRDALPADDPAARLRLIGNLPYNISTPLIFRLLAQTAHIRDMLFMLQREVALRLAAGPGGKNYGRLSVMIALALACEPLFDVPPQAFDPPPKVHSTVLRLTPKSPPLTPRDRRVFNAVVAAAFCQRRKTLRNSLAALAHGEHFARAAIDPGLRAEALSPEQYIALANTLA